MKNKISLLSLVIMGSFVGGSSVMGLDGQPQSSPPISADTTQQPAISLRGDLTRISVLAGPSLKRSINALSVAIQKSEMVDAQTRKDMDFWTRLIVQSHFEISSLKLAVAQTKAEMDSYNQKWAKNEAFLNTYEKDDTSLESREKITQAQMAKLDRLKASLKAKITELDNTKRNLKNALKREYSSFQKRSQNIDTVQNYIKFGGYNSTIVAALQNQLNDLTKIQYFATLAIQTTTAKLKQHNITLRKDHSELASDKSTLTKDTGALAKDSAELKFNEKGIKLDTNAANFDQKQGLQSTIENEMDTGNLEGDREDLTFAQKNIVTDQNTLTTNVAAEEAAREIEENLRAMGDELSKYTPPSLSPLATQDPSHHDGSLYHPSKTSGPVAVLRTSPETSPDAQKKDESPDSNDKKDTRKKIARKE
ncbi:MAG: hypothetical protein B7Y25_05990 [Alphaproteobacteria bacterium 16-39-46]|nr:MAG: hypothetical protein B7Y25_05990 [Alphaproteobacteria bacterium 16-39-46]OZA42414.1 MAG: hypothetical protein B7X84_06050 [Alphaproteobacteria bacterium 17-39-52]HQS83946.1 hypothetical protein [Alphaproteobacteria bacterium]HQS93792.1 hypothetical protein [Alphaproteobacteria bacterium]